MSKRQEQSRRFWTQFCNHLRQRGSPLEPLEPMMSDYKHYRDFQIGIPNIAVRASQRVRVKTDQGVKKVVDAALIIKGRDAETYFDALLEQQTEIHKECGELLSWYAVDSEARIAFIKVDVDPTDEKDWPNQHEWLATKFEKLNEVFRPRIERLKS